MVGEAGDGEEAAAKAIETNPDVILLEYLLPLMTGLEVVRRVRALRPETEFLMFTLHDNEVLIEQALKAGVRGYLFKSDPSRDLIAALTALAAHQPFFTSKVSLLLLEALLATPDEGSIITNRQRCIVQLDRRGLSNQTDRQNSRHRPQDRGNASRAYHAPARSFLFGGLGALCRASPTCGGLSWVPRALISA